MTKIIKASLDEIVEAVMPLYHRYDGESKCTLEKTSYELGDDEPMECSCDYTDRLRTALEKFVVEEHKCTGERDQNGICKDCGKKSYHMIPTERKEESVEIHHHSTASVLSIDMYQHEGESEIFKSEMWMDYSVFEKLKEAIDAKANGELSFLFLTTPKKGGDDEA